MDIIQRAVEAAQQHYSDSEWASLRPQERTAAVYREIRRLDEAAAGMVKPHQQPAMQQRSDRPINQAPAKRVTSLSVRERLRRSG